MIEAIDAIYKVLENVVLWLVSTDGFTTRWETGNWLMPNGWVNIVSNGVSAFNLFVIPIVIFASLKRVYWGVYTKIMRNFGGFISLCAAGYAFKVLVFWYPFYNMYNVVDVLTAAMLTYTVWRLIPQFSKVLQADENADRKRALFKEPE